MTADLSDLLKEIIVDLLDEIREQKGKEDQAGALAEVLASLSESLVRSLFFKMDIENAGASFLESVVIPLMKENPSTSSEEIENPS